MRIFFILTSSLIIYAQAAPQLFNLSPKSWRIIINRGRDQSHNIRESQSDNNGRARQALAQYRQPDNQEQQPVDDNQALWGMCWYPMNNAARDLSNRGPAPPPPQYHNPGMHHGYHHNGDHHHNPWNNHGHRPPPPHSNHHGPPPPPPHDHNDHHHHHHHGHYHHAPPPPPPRPMHRPHKGMEYPLEICQESLETSTQSGHDIIVTNPASSAPLISTAETPKNDGVETVTQNTINGGSETSTTEFDWNNYFVDGTPDNTDGIGLIDIRTGGVTKPQ